ncbi:SseB family protein [Mycolicibacterium baixiangningiae]|uniref:SseB family protein n=1 Tax=Mycolicibacterium baixiangningiae TaxID=2761578 RepID=UPI00186752E3|nr:SseB family protein [Mycolicibacterium baixiangningiae]
MELVDNVIVRRAVGEFAAHPDQRRALEVLRSCMYGELLFDVTGSDAPVDGSFPGGSRLQIRGGTGPGGGRALFAFTRQEEIARLYAPDTHTQSMVTPAAGALGMARQQRDAWLYIDPAGPTCALSAADIDFALRNPNNEPLKTALAALDTGHADRGDVLRVLVDDGPILLGADEKSVAGKVVARSMALADGSTALVGFTSAPEVVAFNPSDAVVALTAHEVLEMVRRDGYSAIVINPAGPSISYARNEIGNSA